METAPMMIRRPLAVLLLVLAAGCASTAGPGIQRIEPGQTVEFDDRAYQLRQVQEDFVLLRYRDPGTEKGIISGFVDEVFRISRYDLGEGRWYAHEKLPGVYLQWLGFDSFGLAHDRKAVGNAEVVMLR
jgi:hypothetical protein